MGGPKPFHPGSQISNMCGDLRWNFEEIPSLPEQKAAKTRSGFAVQRGKNSKKWLCHFFDTLGGAIVAMAPFFSKYRTYCA